MSVRPVAAGVMRAHILLYRFTGGLIGGSVLGRRMLLLTTVGARTGKRRTVALLYVEDETDLVLIASYGGSPRHPAWYLNLRRNPRCTVQLRGRRLAVVAETVADEDRERLWAKVVETFSGYAEYQRRTTRKIPVMKLKPVTL